MDAHLKKIQEDVDAMNKVFAGDEPDVEEEVKTDPPSTDPPVEDAEEPETDSPTTDEPKTAPPSTDAPDERDKTIDELRKKLAEKDEKPVVPKTKAPVTEPPDVDFVGDIDIEDLTPKNLNVLLNKSYKQAIADARARGVEVTQTLPELVAAVAALQQATKDFYEENADLGPFKKVVGTVFEELRLANPNQTYEELISSVAPEVRSRLELPEPSKKKVDKGNPPRLPRKKSKSGVIKDEPKVGSVSSDIDEMNKSLGR
jgi:hypothetical protein